MSTYRGSLADARGRCSTKPREQYIHRDRIPQAAASHRPIHVADSSFTTDGYSKPIAPSTHPLSSTSFRVGEIIRLPHLVPSMDARETNPELRIYSKVAGFICPKNRFAIVVGIYKDRMVVLPMYTCHAAGVSKKSEDYKLTAISIRHPRDTTKSYAPEVLARETITTNNAGGYIWKVGSHVNVLDVVSVNYSWNIERGHGSLSEDSSKRLQSRVWIAQQMMHRPLGKQQSFYEERSKDAIAREKETLTVVHPQIPHRMTTRSTRPAPSAGGSYAQMASFR